MSWICMFLSGVDNFLSAQKPHESILTKEGFPKELIGDWYDLSSGALDFMIRRDVVIANGRAGQITMDKEPVQETLACSFAGKKEPLYYHQTGPDTWQIGFDKAHFKSYTKNKSRCNTVVSKDCYDDLPIRMDTSTICGFIFGYPEKGLGNTVAFMITDPLLGIYRNYLAAIRPDGWFKVRIPVYAPVQVTVRSDYDHGSLYLDPGKTLFVAWGEKQTKFMGPLAELNEDMAFLNKELNVSFKVFYEGIGMESPDKIKSVVLAEKTALNNQLDSLYRTGHISTKAFQAKKADIKYEMAQLLLSYDMFYPNAYRKKHGLGQKVKIPASTPGDNYYDFLKAGVVDNVDLLRSANGYIFINRLKFLDWTFPRSIPMLLDSIIKFSAAKHVQFTKEEQAWIDRESYKRTDTTDKAALSERNQKVLSFLGKYGFEYILYYRKKYRDSALRSKNIISGFCSDVMYVQDFSDKVYSQLTPVDKNALIRIQSEVDDPALRDIMKMINLQVKARIKRNKDEGGFAVRSSTDIKADKIFESVVHRYKGNVLYIDFWATWCTPCKMAIEKIAAVKKELANKKVKFIYLTDQSSPENTWHNYIPTVKGEHYRLNAEQWLYLKNKFQVNGIPHVVLVDKMGNVVDPNYQELNTKKIKEKIEQLL